RDALAYIDLYGLRDLQTMYRGTLRHTGHCALWNTMGTLGLYDDVPRRVQGGTYRALMASLLDATPAEVEAVAASRAGVAIDAPPMAAMRWLGLFEPTALPADPIAPLDALVARMLEQMQYRPGERDMVVLRHVFT